MRRCRLPVLLVAVTGLVLLGGALAAAWSAAPADRTGLDALREQVLGLVRLDGTLKLRLVGVELHGRDTTYRLDVAGEKTAAGAVVASLTLAPAGQPPALRVDARATATGRTDVDVHVVLSGEPARLGPLWPAALPAPPSLVTRGDLRLVDGGDAVVTGRLTLGAAVPAVLDLAARFDGATSALEVSRWTLAQGEPVRLAGTLRAVPAGAGVRVTSTARGRVDGAWVDGRVRYDGGDLDGEITVEPASLTAVWRRLGMGEPAIDARARAVRARITGKDAGRTLAVTVDATLEGIEAPALTGAGAVDGTLDGAVRLGRGDTGVVAGPLERAVLTLTHGGVRAAIITARSRGTALWPLRVEVQVPDAAAVTPLLPPATRLAGSGRLAGEAEAAGGVFRFRGVLDAEVAAAELSLAVPVAVTALAAAGVPVYWNAGGAERPGSVSIGRLGASGLVVEDVRSSATLIDGLLRLPDLRYRHHDGRGSGWAELGLGGSAPPLRARVEGERVDLAAAVRESGSTLAQVTGRVRYTGSLQRLPGRGVDAVVQLHSQEGGEIGIEAIERLLASAAVEVESTGLLRQTLENLRVFEYESLAGELRAVDGQGTVDLSIKGRRRLGLFPGPVQAINFRNVPLDVLGTALDGGISR